MQAHKKTSSENSEKNTKTVLSVINGKTVVSGSEKEVNITETVSLTRKKQTQAFDFVGIAG